MARIGALKEPALILGTGMASGKPFVLQDLLLEYSAIVTGATGAGKTTGVMQKLIKYIVTNPQRPGALIINCKDDYANLVRKFAAAYDCVERVVVLEPGGKAALNLLPEWMPSYKAAESMVLSCVNPGEIRHPLNAFWLQAAIRVLDLAISLARASFDAKNVTLEDVNQICTDFAVVRQTAGNPQMGDYLTMLLKILEEKVLNTPTDHPEYSALTAKLRRLQQETLRTISLDEKPRTSIGAEIERVLFSVTPDEIRRTFCAGETATFGGISEIVDSGKIVVLNFPVQRWGLSGKLIASMLKRQLWAYLMAKRENGASPADRACYFVCDEFHFVADFDESAESDNNVSSILRSLKCRAYVSVQECNALFANTSPAAHPMVRNFLRNMRLGIHLRQNASREFVDILTERGVPWTAALQLPMFPKHTALVTHDDLGFRLVRLDPIEWDPFAENTAKIRQLREMRERALISAIPEAKGFLKAIFAQKTLLVSSSGETLTCHMDRLETELREHEIPVIRFSGEVMAREDVGILIMTLGRTDFRFIDGGVVLVDQLEEIPASLRSMIGLRTLVEGKFIDMGFSEMRIDLGKLKFICSMKTKEQSTFGFALGGESSSFPALPDFFRKNFKIVVLKDEAAMVREAVQ